MAKRLPKKTRPLAGKRIVITRRKEQAAGLRQALEAQGGRVVELPTIAIVPPKSWEPADDAIRGLADYDWVIFTSTNGVDFFFERLRRAGKSAAVFRSKKVAAIGPATARALRRRRVRVKVVPERFVAEGLLAALGRESWRGKRVLIPRAAKAREILPQQLRKKGATVHVVAVYQTVAPTGTRAKIAKLFAGHRKPKAVTFTSSSTVKNFTLLAGRSRLRRLLNGVAIASIGPVTSRTARALGLKVTVEARRHTMDGLVTALGEYFRRQE